ncbi:MAG: hypothetical protein KF708_14580 [Pirellulales bacterium]|nr:hypothetical protein [Pirellulales bacterium]
MFNPVWLPDARKTYDDLSAKAKASVAARKKTGKTKSTKDEGLFKQVRKTIDFLLNNPKHPSLNTHEYDSLEHPYDKSKKVFEAYVQNNTPGAYRLFWCYGPKENEISLIAITSHP